MSGMASRGYSGHFFSCSFPFWFVAGGAVPIHVVNARLDRYLGNCKVPQRPFQGPKCGHLWNETKILQNRLFAQSGLQKSPSLPRMSPEPPPRDRQRRHRIPRGTPQKAFGEPWRPPGCLKTTTPIDLWSLLPLFGAQGSPHAP